MLSTPFNNNNNMTYTELLRQEKYYRDLSVDECFRRLLNVILDIKDSYRSGRKLSPEDLESMIETYELIKRIVRETKIGRALVDIHNIPVH